MLNQPKVPTLGFCTKSVKRAHYPLVKAGPYSMQGHFPGCRKIPNVILLLECESHVAMLGSCQSAPFLLARIELLGCAVTLAPVAGRRQLQEQQSTKRKLSAAWRVCFPPPSTRFLHLLP